MKSYKVVKKYDILIINKNLNRGVDDLSSTIAIGEQDFSKIITYHSFYIDKTNFIKDWWENRDAVTLITRPRRFGKTLTMSMLEHFFSLKYAGRSDLFENLDIWQENEYKKLQGSYPVIFLSFANVKSSDFVTVRKLICQQIVNLYEDYRFLLDDGFLKDESAAYFKRITINMDDSDLSLSLCQLSRYLYKYYNKKVIILLDEYDTPMQEAYTNGYWDKIVHLTQGLFHAAFKTNPYLERGLMTGITRVSKESVFSDLNNLEVITTTSRKYASAFGFTETEVFQALEEYGLLDKKDDVKCWYDGFRFGEFDNIYNPWSVIKFLSEKELAPYWENTSSNKLIGRLIQKSSPHMKQCIEDLVQHKSLCVVIDEQIVFDQLDDNENAVWSLLLASGYLKVTSWKMNHRGKKECVLDIVNFEVSIIFEDLFTEWFSVCSSSYNDFIKAMFMHDLKKMNIFINNVAASTISYFDVGNRISAKSEPERFYHGLVLGLIVDLNDRYTITSNRESGFGRYDVLLEPKNQTDDGIILEFKVADPETEKSMTDTVRVAIKQIIEKRYATVLESKCSKDKIRIYGFAFRGKNVFIDGGYLKDYERLGF